MQLVARVSTSAASYQLTQNNLPGRGPLDSDYSVANGAGRGRGFELDVRGQVFEGLEIVANYSWMVSEFIRHPNWQGNVFRSTPRHSDTLWGHYQLPIAGLPDLVAHYQLGQFDFRFKVEDIMDQRYVSSSIYDDTVSQGNRRTALFLVAMKFG